MNKDNIRLEGQYVYVEEVQTKYFTYIVEWRNNPENNRFLNQPFKLTMELQSKWYEEKYLKDDTQGLFVMVDKATGTPFGTLGWTDYDGSQKRCILGRALVGNWDYKGSKELMEGYLLVQDYLHNVLDITVSYIHVVNENKKVISLNKRWGYRPNDGDIQFPRELIVNGMHQTEYVRTVEQYKIAREKIVMVLNNL